MSFGVGLECFLHGTRLARAKPLRPFVWLPMAVGLVVIASLLVAGYAWVRDFVVWLVDLLPAWLAWLAAVLRALAYVAGLLLAGWLFGFLAVVFASPFLGLLSARAEREAFGTAPDFDESALRAALSAIRREARKLAYHLPRLVAVFALTLLPVLNLIAPFVVFAFGAWMMAVQFADYAAENRGLDFRDTLALLRTNRAAALGFGVLPTLLLAIPFAALFVIPATACGAAVLWRRLAEQRDGVPLARARPVSPRRPDPPARVTPPKATRRN